VEQGDAVLIAVALEQGPGDLHEVWPARAQPEDERTPESPPGRRLGFRQDQEVLAAGDVVVAGQGVAEDARRGGDGAQLFEPGLGPCTRAELAAQRFQYGRQDLLVKKE